MQSLINIRCVNLQYGDLIKVINKVFVRNASYEKRKGLKNLISQHFEYPTEDLGSAVGSDIHAICLPFDYKEESRYIFVPT